MTCVEMTHDQIGQRLHVLRILFNEADIPQPTLDVSIRKPICFISDWVEVLACSDMWILLGRDQSPRRARCDCVTSTIFGLTLTA
jgi:hypothetical protein